jgi:hypothetical protein
MKMLETAMKIKAIKIATFSSIPLITFILLALLYVPTVHAESKTAKKPAATTVLIQESFGTSFQIAKGQKYVPPKRQSDSNC